MTFSRVPDVHVKMSVYDYADLLRKYAPPKGGSKRGVATQPTGT